MQNGFQRNTSLETFKLSVSNNDSNVHVYPNAAHNPTNTVLCFSFYRREFKSLEPMNESRYGQGSMVAGEKLYVIGGISGSMQRCDSIEALNLSHYGNGW